MMPRPPSRWVTLAAVLFAIATVTIALLVATAPATQ
jgi:hypothetical protein